MPIIASAKKKLRADKQKQIINRRVKEKVRLALKLFQTSPTESNLSRAFSSLDTAAKKGVIPVQRADRKKARLTASLAKAPKSSAKPKSAKITKKGKGK